MYSTLIGKVDKAHRYAEQRDRFAFHTLSVTIRGDNSDHDVRFEDGAWHCDCEHFLSQPATAERACAHTMALEVMLGGMLRAGPRAA